MMNSCDKSSALSLDPHLKAVSYFIFRICIPSYMKEKELFSVLRCYSLTIYVALHKEQQNSFTVFCGPHSDISQSLWFQVIHIKKL